MAYLLDVEFIESSSEGRLALYRHSLVKEAYAEGYPLMLRAVGSGWDDAAQSATQRTEISPPVPYQILEATPSQLRLRIDDWPDAAPLGELMQFSVGDRGGELYLWVRARGIKRSPVRSPTSVDVSR